MTTATKAQKAEIKLCLETIANLKQSLADAEAKGWSEGGLAQANKAHLARFEAYLAKLEAN
jgi:hypothetical protein